MPWFAVPAAIATIGVFGKLLARHLRGRDAALAIEDPPGIRTVARLELRPGGSTDDLLLAVAAELARGFDEVLAVTPDAVRARRHPLAAETDVVRLSRRAGRAGHTLELTRAWTGGELGDEAILLLHRIHDALIGHPSVVAVTWHARQDRELTDGFGYPALVQGAARRGGT